MGYDSGLGFRTRDGIGFRAYGSNNGYDRVLGFGLN
jgi:hypothetical protein